MTNDPFKACRVSSVVESYDFPDLLVLHVFSPLGPVFNVFVTREQGKKLRVGQDIYVRVSGKTGRVTINDLLGNLI